MTRPAFDTQYEVVVCGGGVAGAAASLSAARCGRKTCLLEKTVQPGGLACSGNVLFFLPIADSKGRQTLFGLAEELLLASVKYGPGKADPKSPSLANSFNPASFVLALDELLEDAGVELWLDSLVCGARLSKGRVSAVEIENKSGRGLVRGKRFIDATGDASLAFLAGAPCSNAACSLAHWSLEASSQAAASLLEAQSFLPQRLLFRIGSDERASSHQEEQRLFSGVDSKDVSEFILAGRRLLRKRYGMLPDGDKAKVFPLALPSQADFRVARRIEGEASLGSCDAFRHFDDCVGIVPNWRDRSELWALPYSALLPKGVGSLLAAGRCISTKDEAWSVFRSIPACILSGEVAGLAASLSIDLKLQPGSLPREALQAALARRSFPLDIDKFRD